MTADSRALVYRGPDDVEVAQRLSFYANSFGDFERSCHLPWAKRRWMQRRLGAEARRLRALFEAQLVATRRAAAAHPVGSPWGEWFFACLMKTIAHVRQTEDFLGMYVEKWRTEPAPIPTLSPDVAAALTVQPANTIAPLPARARRTTKKGLPMPRPLNPPVVWFVDHYRFRCRMRDGGRPWVDLPVGLTEAEALAKAKSFATDAAKKYDTVKKAPRVGGPAETFEQWCARWIASRLPTGMTSVYSDGKRLAKWAFPSLGKKPMATIAKDDLKRFVLFLDNAVRSGTMSPKSAINIWGLVSKMFDDAARAKDPALCIREDNPARDVRGPDKGSDKAKVFLYPEEVTKLLACDAVALKFRRVVALATYLGIRAGELKALCWEDIDLEKGTIHVHRGFDRMRKRDKATKGDAARRYTMEPAVLPLLRAMKAEGTGEGRVTLMPSQSGLAVALREHLRKAGVTRADLFADDDTRKPMTFHDLRATAITWWIVRGDGVEKAQARAGHVDIATTQGYQRTAGEVEGQITAVFPALPDSLLGTGKDTGNVRKGGEGEANSAKLKAKTEWRRRESNHALRSPHSVLSVDPDGQRQDTGPDGVESQCDVPSNGPHPDTIEAALIDALNKAVAAGAFDAVKTIVDELAARRKARAGVVDLGARRRERGGGGL